MKAWLAPLAAACLALAPAAAGAEEPPVPRLQASGTGEVRVVPDIAIVTIGVTSRAAEASAALDANSADLEKAIAAIRAAGVAETDIATAGFSVSPVYRQDTQPSDRPPAIVGYQVSNELRVTIRDLAGSGALLDEVVKAGANQVHGIAFDIADRSAAADRAIRAAIAAARSRAELMAAAAGVRLVRILSVDAGEGGGGPVFARMDMAAKVVPVMPGEQTVSANATISWEIAPQ